MLASLSGASVVVVVVVVVVVFGLCFWCFLLWFLLGKTSLCPPCFFGEQSPNWWRTSSNGNDKNIEDNFIFVSSRFFFTASYLCDDSRCSDSIKCCLLFILQVFPCCCPLECVIPVIPVFFIRKHPELSGADHQLSSTIYGFIKNEINYNLLLFDQIDP